MSKQVTVADKVLAEMQAWFAKEESDYYQNKRKGTLITGTAKSPKTSYKPWWMTKHD